MKNGKKILLAIIAALTAVAVAGCGLLDNISGKTTEARRPERNKLEIDDDEVTHNTVPEEKPENDRPEDIICYYGCPNSKRVKKLNLRKNNI